LAKGVRKMLVAFVVDTSGSMNQREGGGLRLVDLAKAAVEHFLKLRARDLALAGRPSPDLRYSDRYFLLTTEEGPSALKATSLIPQISSLLSIFSVRFRKSNECPCKIFYNQ
jgi:hypothetical protein